ncbi:MAG TPA: IS1380 family transposase [Terriglobia bacterium]|nr:IS1380 family transposase [Terriglobia bacterium]
MDIILRMRKASKPSPTESPLLFEVDPEPASEVLTALGGIPLVVQAFRSLGAPGSVKQHVQIKARQRGYDEATFVESFVILNDAGGDCLEDFGHLREDEGLSELIGHELPSPEAAWNFLHAFHEEKKIEDAQQRRLPGEMAYIPEESAPLAGPGQVNRELVQELGSRCADQQVATVDQDATIIESRKREALATYEGERGYQPMLAVWAEMNVVLADEFRDGNVPAQKSPLTVARAAFAALPSTVKTYYYRGDSACHESELLTWLRDEKREGGPQGFIGFAISARMSEALHQAIVAIPEAEWKPYPKSTVEEVRECAEVPFVPGEKSEHKVSQPLRYVAVRVRKRQGELFADGSAVRHFAVLSNVWEWKPEKLIGWHREKAGTVEMVHDVLKNELAAGVLPSKYFGANAAWLRLAAITHNVLVALKRLALPAEMLSARPKRLRFLFLHTAGHVICHARKILLRLATARERLWVWVEIGRCLPLRA